MADALIAGTCGAHFAHLGEAFAENLKRRNQ
jgi:hypothetical protein